MTSVFQQSVNAIVKHYRKGDLNWPMIIYITLAHVAGIIFFESKRMCILW